MHLGKEHIAQTARLCQGTRILSVSAALYQKIIIADTRNLLTFNYMIARFMFTLLICTFASKLVS